MTTVLLVDSNSGHRSQLGRYVNVRPDQLGLLTSTARTFIQEGVTTEYATQVLGTTLDNGRLYAHLLTKSSRVLYDHDSVAPTARASWVVDDNLINQAQHVNIVRNTDYVQPNQVEPYVVFPTTKSDLYRYVENPPKEVRQVNPEEELLQAPSNHPRIPYQEQERKVFTVSSSSSSSSISNNRNGNVKMFKIDPLTNRDHRINYAFKDSSENDILRKDEAFGPSKVKEWDNLPTFTVRNEFSPSGYSFLGDIPEFDINTEKSKFVTAAERKAKLLFRAGLTPKPDLKTVTYTGFADFTTTVGDTVIVFSPQTADVKPPPGGQVTKISVEATLRPSEPGITTKLKTFLLHEPGMQTKTVEGHKLNMQTQLPTMVIDASNRMGKSKAIETSVDIEAKSKVLAHEQKISTPALSDMVVSSTVGRTIIFASDDIEPSEMQLPMLSTPSDEDIAKIFSSLQAQQAQTSTQPLNTPSTIFFDEESTRTSTRKRVKATAKTIFFDDKPSASVELPKITTNPPTTTTEREITTPNVDTTENLLKDEPTTNEILTTSENGLSFTTPEDSTNEIDTETDVKCTEGQQIIPTTVYRTLTYLTTFYIPVEKSTSTSVKSNKVVSTEIGFETHACSLTPSTVDDTTITPSAITTTTEQIPEQITLEDTTTDVASTTQEMTTEAKDDTTEPVTDQETTVPIQLESTTMEITTEQRHVTESEPETTETTTEDGEEVELVFKTLYTTYTYLTTYFQESTSSVASRKEVITNVITSTIDPSKASEDPTAGLIEKDSFKSKPVTFDDIAAIAPSKVPPVQATSVSNSADDEDEDNELLDASQPTPSLNDNQIKNTVNAVKTYYTTYTYFTTIFVDGETEISSRTEVYTNFVTIKSTAPIESILQTKDVDRIDNDDEDDSTELKNKLLSLNMAPTNSYNSTINRDRATKVPSSSEKSVNKNNNYSTLHRTTTDSNDNDLLDLSEYETISTMVTDVRSSTSQGERRILESTENGNVLLDDQIVSESNNDSDILPSPTLLLQTSYTTFTYFTTMYQGTTSSNIVSRLDTVTNVVTETLSPTHSLSVEDLNLPITYFTTFTYWTTLYKEGTTKVTSREDTISNIVTPTATITTTPASEIIQMSAIEKDVTTPSDIENLTPSIAEDTTEEIKPTSVKEVEELTTYFTTYTYYTTSYVGNSTVLKSRLETVTNVMNKTEIETNQIGRAISKGGQNNIEDEEDVIKTTPISTEEAEESGDGVKPTGLLSTIVSTVETSGLKTVLSTDVYGTYIDGLYAKVLESTSSVITDTSGSIEPSPVTETLKPTGIVSINKGKIVDAEGISTLYYTTQAVGTYIDNLYAQVIESTTSLNVDEEKKSSQALEPSVAHKTGLVRFIEGSIEQNHTTTLYQSKVLGTVIEGRYAQIIESTSSFIVDKIAASKVAEISGIAPTPTKGPDGEIRATNSPISPSPVVIEGSISDASKLDSENTTEGDEEEEEEEEVDEDGNTRIKSRLTFQSRKRTFTPVIRPFASRPRPSFAPKRKGSGVGSATTITRSDFTPTVTAVPASKSGSRFGGRRSSSSSSINPSAASSSGRRFQRPKSSSQLPGASSSFAPSRRGSSRVQPTSSGGFGSSSRRGGFRSSSAGSAASSIRPSSAVSANNRFRLRPTVARGVNANNVTPPSTAADSENDLTTLVTDPTTGEDEQETSPPTTTESTRRNQNPLLRFRRPPLSRPPPVTRTTTAKPASGNINQAPTRGSSRSANRATTTSTTAAPARTLYNRGGAAQTRPRPGNSLFPRRNLFTTTTTTEAPAEDEEEDENEEVGEDTDYEGSDTNSQTERAPASVSEANKATSAKPYNGVQIRPFGALRRRTKRQVPYSRFRRPTGRTTTSAPIVVEEPETEPPKLSRTSKSRFTGRGRPRLDQSTTPAPRITPSRASLNQGRSQFTLRDSGAGNARNNNFRRPATSSSRRYSQTTPRSRARPVSSESSFNSRKTTTRPRSTSRRRTTATRGGTSTEIESNYLLPGYDGTITVTHQIPTEITIPVVNGKITEYKNIITAKLSTEVLSPQQYTTSVSPFGKQVTLLLSHTTGYGANGEKIFTQFILNENPTTSVIFTPTYIRGRKTSFSHVIPSTAYVVEPVTSTITPNLANQAPLANILLSQLLLGNQQNPLANVQNPGAPATPVTEFNTKTTTYVTTVTSATSTILPITFRGKQILTTIIDTNINVITATEFITDTIIVTPTPALQQNQQLNSLLVPLLLQQQQAAQQQQQQQQQQFLNPLFQSPAGVVQISKQDPFFNQDLFQDQIKQNLADDEEVYVEEEDEQHDVTETAPKRVGGKLLRNKKNNKRPTLVEPPKETSVITLYVSGRTPGEFSTVLSTVVVGEENKKKREATYVVVEPSRLNDDLLISTLEYVDSYLMPGSKDSSDLHEIIQTESLESIIGDVNKQIVTDVPNLKPSKTKKYKLKYEKSTGAAKQVSGNFLAQ